MDPHKKLHSRPKTLKNGHCHGHGNRFGHSQCHISSAFPVTVPKNTTLWDCAESEQHSISDALLLHWTISNQTVLLQLQLQPPLEPRVLHRGPKKYPLGPFSVPFWKEKVTSAKLRYTMLSLKQGWEGGVYKGEIFFSSFLDELEHLEHV